MTRRILVLVALVAAPLWATTVGAQEVVVDDGPTAEGVVTGRPHLESASGHGVRPRFELACRWDQLWQAGSPHGPNNAALDFGPRRTGGIDDVVAAAAGTVQRVTCSGGSYPRVDHGNGWVSHYYHVINV